ncbi:hypothetical protein V499_03663 [Pseudogymnoascus sp. VKM F-103]|uniref:Vacuolar calcium ion transporter n=1 Tax=Pseudogymnoascus verrucosus TaxID=342668 RepID=A0A1B8GCL6_9PEZI|nr:uncharacterized protein VE01_08330 [Pseudogymnoascus verrucosus]KFY76786.1 hypothetical protein V499_03663 [Pseudogymnoascus sp. VKM F-103]OBT93574.1 hypothetical protein VE01_08330 [Pseudogymnoascus verrucosus]
MSESDPFLNDSAELGGGRAHREDVELGWRRLLVDAGRQVAEQPIVIKVLLGFAPLGFIAGFLGWNAVLVSVFNFLAIIPLSALISDASDTLANRWGSLLGGLVNATFGNTVELIVGILAINQNEIRLAQSTMLGSILSDILLVQGCCFIAAAHGTSILSVNAAIVDALSSLMLVAAVALILPTILYSTLPKGGEDINDKILSFSRATAVVLLLIYVIFLYFQLWTHPSVFLDEKDDVHHEAHGDGIEDPQQQQIDEATREAIKSQEEDDTPSVSEVYSAVAILIISAALITKCTQYFITSLDETAKSLHITKTFIAIFLIPLASNAPELSQVVAASKQRKINFAIGVIIGSILQIALFVLPFLVVIGWYMGRAMDLYFETSQTYILLLAVLSVNQVLQDGKYTYFHGIMLLSMYTVIALAIFIEPYN